MGTSEDDLGDVPSHLLLSGMNSMLRGITLDYSSSLSSAVQPLQATVEQMQSLMKDMNLDLSTSPDQRHEGRLLLESQSCRGVKAVAPSSNSSIVSSDPAVVSCNTAMQDIMPETVILASIMGAVATTASAAADIQVVGALVGGVFREDGSALI